MNPWAGWIWVILGVAAVLLADHGALFSIHLTSTFVVAAVLYACSHGVRALRMVVLLGQTARSLRGIASAHLVTAPLAAVVPFKLGELARIVAFSIESGRTGAGLQRRGVVWALAAVWVERTFDAFVLATAALGTAWLFPEHAGTARTIAILSLGFLGATATAILLLPDNIDAAKHFVIVRYTSPVSLRLLKGLHLLREALDIARATVSGKVATLVATSLAVWGLEGAALIALTDGVAATPGLLAVLSDAFRPAAHASGLGAALDVHRTMVLVSLIVLAGLGAVAATAVALRRPLPAR